MTGRHRRRSVLGRAASVAFGWAVMGPQEAAAQAVLDTMPAGQRAALGLEEYEALSDEVWHARERDRGRR